MAEGIRLRAWLLGLGPVALVAVVVIAIFVASSGKPAPRADTPSAEPEPGGEVAPAGSAAALPPATTQSPQAPPPPLPSSLPPMIAAAASSLRLIGPPPEPIPELDALARPKGSEQWTVEQKLAYREQALHALDTKEQSLEQEIAIARRRGDSQAVQEKQATLDYLRARRAQIDEAMRKQGSLRDALLDAGSGTD